MCYDRQTVLSLVRPLDWLLYRYAGSRYLHLPVAVHRGKGAIMTYTELFHFLYHARKVLQALAAFTGDEAACDIAGGLDEIADQAWKGCRG